MKKSLSARLSVIFTGIIIAACLILVGTCAGIFKFTETTIKDIRYEDILDGYKTEVKSQVQSGITIRFRKNKFVEPAAFFCCFHDFLYDHDTVIVF